MGLVLIQGPEALLADRVITNVSSRFPNAQISNLHADELEVGVITDSLAPSLFGDQRIVVIRDTQDLTAECADEVLAYLEDEDSNLLLVLWHKCSGFRDLLNRQWHVCTFGILFQQFVEQRFRSALFCSIKTQNNLVYRCNV